MSKPEPRTAHTSPINRLRISLRGAVQGVGFRPFVFRLAEELGLSGWVNNSTQGVFIEAEGPQPVLENFLLRLQSGSPPRSSIQSLESSWLDAVGYRGFEIRESDPGGPKTTLVLPDIASCPDCLREIFDPSDRRHFYPFTNCTNCGPRFSIIRALPYDRANTSMAGFQMCSRCQAEYDEPRDRRFHAQPNACAVCGPHLELWDAGGKRVTPIDFSKTRQVLEQAVSAIRDGKIVAVKGIGGFHLMVSAANEAAVRLLRERKHREEKPLALMFPSLDAVRSVCEVSPLEERLLRSPEAPIVLLRRAEHRGAVRCGERTVPEVPFADEQSEIAPEVAPNNPNLGVMLPHTPLHHLLLSLLQVPVVATSGNLSDEPICIDEHEAVERLCGIADLFLVHNRPIVRAVDDSVTRVMASREMVMRRARGFAPLPIPLSEATTRGDAAARAQTVLGVGAHMKNTVALTVGPQVFVSQHIGDLEAEPAFDAFRRVLGDFQQLYEVSPGIIAADAHPDYFSTKLARQWCDSEPSGPQPKLAGRDAGAASVRFFSVQHHVAHVLSCMAENELAPPVLGVSWDGTGYGLDGTIWGGEFFHVTDSGCQRVAHFRNFPLPGGDKAVKEPRRAALGLLFEMFGEEAFGFSDLSTVTAFSAPEIAALRTMLKGRVNCPVTCSVGRLFDAVASLTGVRQQVRFEGQAAMELEFAREGFNSDEAFMVEIRPEAAGALDTCGAMKSRFVLDWGKLLEQLLVDIRRNSAPPMLATKFHNALVLGIVEVARRVGEERVVLSGGCFQNRYLTETAVDRLRQAGFRPYWHQRVPPNDGGIALGQVVAAKWALTLKSWAQAA